MGPIRRSHSSVTLLAIICSCRAMKLEPVYWNSSNTKFTPGQGLVLYPQMGDKMDIVCPRRASASSGGKEEFYRLYMVTRSQMESCTIDKTDDPLLVCDKLHRDIKITFKFQEFSPYIWGLEFIRGRDYYVTSMSTSARRGLDNTNGGVCRTKSMKLVLKVGQSSSDPPSTLQESPTRFPPARPKSIAKDPSVTEKDVKSKTETDSETGPTTLFVWLTCGGVIVLVIIITLLGLLRRYHQCHRDSQSQRPAPVPLNTFAVPKLDSTSSDNNGSDRSNVVFPPRASDSMVCHHYERVGFDYGAPVYIVQEITPQNPIDVYYKV